MKALAVTRPGQVEIVDDVEMPPLADHECRAKILACGLCNGTDLKIIDNHLSSMEIHFPTLLGHESVGEVVEVGSKVKYIKVGDRFTNPIGRINADCHYHRNWACDMEYGIVQDQRLMRENGINETISGATCPLPRDIDPCQATAILTLKEMYSALQNFHLQPGMDVLVYGDGPVGQALAQCARILGAEYIMIVGHHDDRLQRIANCVEVDQAVNSHKQSVVECAGDQRFDIAIDAVGRIDIIQEAAALLKPRGRVGITGVLSPEQSTLRLTGLPNNVAIQMLNWPHGEHAVHNVILELIKNDKIHLADYLSHQLPFAQAAKAVNMLRQRSAWRIALIP